VRDIEFKLGNLVRHKPGSPVMMIDGSFCSGKMVDALVDCVWMEDKAKRSVSFPFSELNLVFADGTPRDHAAEE
jgi:uncharacterized protein YodC (DUF2158 family)